MRSKLFGCLLVLLCAGCTTKMLDAPLKLGYPVFSNEETIRRGEKISIQMSTDVELWLMPDGSVAWRCTYDKPQ